MDKRIFPILFLNIITTNTNERQENINDNNPTN